jgi:hypothetical protein
MATLRDAAVFLAVAYAAVLALMWLAQERLQFYPRPDSGPAVAPPGWSVEEVRFATRDGTQVAGFLVRPPVAPVVDNERPAGNAEEVTEYAPAAAQS